MNILSAPCYRRVALHQEFLNKIDYSLNFEQITIDSPYIKKQDFLAKTLSVRPKGFEPLSVVPETTILSIELRAHIGVQI